MARRSCGKTPGWRKEGRKVVVQLGVVPLRIRRRQSIACPLWQPGPEWTRARAIFLMRSPVRERLRFWSNLMVSCRRHGSEHNSVSVRSLFV